AVRGVRLRDLFYRQHVGDGIHPRAAVLLRYLDAHEAHLPHLADGLHRELAGLVELSGDRRNALLRELARRLADHLMLVAEREVHTRGHVNGHAVFSLIFTVGCCSTLKMATRIISFRWASDDGGAQRAEGAGRILIGFGSEAVQKESAVWRSLPVESALAAAYFFPPNSPPSCPAKSDISPMLWPCATLSSFDAMGWGRRSLR